MLRAPLQRLYVRLGARYPRVVLVLAFLLSFFVVGGGVLLLNLYVDISLRTFWRILVVSAILVAARTTTAPADRWLRGERTRPGLRGPEPAFARDRGAGRARRRLHDLLRALGAARALGGRAARGPARGHRARDRRRLRRPRARAGDRRDRAPGRVVQPDGRRPGRARAPARGVRRLRRSAARRARPRGGDGAGGRGGRGDRPLRRHPRVHRLRRARHRERGRHRAQRLLRARGARLVRHGGHANKFVGDGLLGVFGAPEHHADHADRGVAAALEIAEVVRNAYAGRLRIGIGVNSGPVVAGTIGGGGRVEFTVIGDTVNTAARVEAITRETDDTVLVTDATWALLQREHGGFRERGSVTLRGRSEPVTLHVALAAAGEPVARRQSG